MSRNDELSARLAAAERIADSVEQLVKDQPAVYLGTLSSIGDAATLSQRINAANAARIKRAEAAAGFVVALILGILGAVLLLHYLLPCAEGALCAATVINTRPGLLSRLRYALRGWYLRHLISAAENDLLDMHDDMERAQDYLWRLPQQISSHRLCIDGWRLELADIDLANRSR